MTFSTLSLHKQMNLFQPMKQVVNECVLHAQNILTAMDQTWHPEHFFCSHCGDLFGPDGETTGNSAI